MKISIIVIGDELLIGQVTDTNSGFIARHIAPAGWEVNDVQVVADTAEAIKQAISRAFENSEVVLTTGGLGPTKDDITKATLCSVFGGTLREDSDVTENIRNVFALRGLKMNDLTAAQALVPTTAKIIQNRVGTAPVMWFEKNNPKRVLVAMPGVPFETEYTFSKEVFPRLLAEFPGPDAVVHHTLMVGGISESDLATRLDKFEKDLPSNFHLAYLPKPGIIRLRLDAHGEDAESLEKQVRQYSEALRNECGGYYLCDGDMSPAEILLHALQAQNLTLSTAESCTGGNIAHLITAIAGASAVMKGGVVAYSNEVKMHLLGVKESTLAEHGAVSIPVVEQMALGSCRATGSDIAMATSGIAGPGGATEGKPVGTVCIAAAATGGTIISHTYHFPGNRERVIERASTTALLLALKLLP